MRSLILSGVFLASSTIAISLNDFSPYVNPLEYSGFPARLFKRQGCPGGFSNCAAQGNSGACCPTNQICTKDSGGNVACCPLGSACTGTIPDGGGEAEATSTSAGFVLGGSSTGSPSVTSGPSQTPTSATTSGFVFVSPTSAPSGVASTIPNAPFPFFIIPTTFGNAAECSSYATACSSQYQACLATLGGGVNGVTVSGANVGVTVQGVSTTVASASGVCGSLSSQACHGLQTPICSQFGGGGSSNTASGFIVSGGAVSESRPTGCPGLLYAVGVGAVAGVAQGWM